MIMEMFLKITSQNCFGIDLSILATLQLTESLFLLSSACNQMA